MNREKIGLSGHLAHVNGRAAMKKASGLNHFRGPGLSPFCVLVSSLGWLSVSVP